MISHYQVMIGSTQISMEEELLGVKLKKKSFIVHHSKGSSVFVTVLVIPKPRYIPSTVRDTDLGVDVRASGTASMSNELEHSI